VRGVTRLRTAIRFVLVVVLAPTSLLALDPAKRATQYTHDVWQSRGDLPLDSVQAVIQSSDGYLWIGTPNGLLRFDGITLTPFDTRETPGFPNNNVQALATSRRGGIWVGTEGGLVYLRDGHATTYTTANGLPNNVVRALHADRDDNLWIGMHGGGVARFRDGRFDVYGTAQGLSNNVVRALLRDRNGDMWIGTDAGGLNRLRDGVITVYTAADGLGDNSIWALLEDSRGRLWIGTAGAGVRERLPDGRFEARAMGLPSRFVRTMVEDRDGSLWVGTEGGGLHRYRHGELSSFRQEQDLSSDTVRALLEDREGSLWIGTIGGGLNRLRDAKFTTLTTREGLRSDLTRVVYEDRNRNLWIGTDGGGLHRLTGNALSHYTTSTGLSGNTIRAVLQDRTGGVWVGTLNAGLNYIRGRRITRIAVADQTVRSLLEDRDGSIWIGTYGGGLNRYANGRVSTYTTRDGLSSDFITALAQSQDGTLWIGTNGGGLNRFAAGQFAAYTSGDGLVDPQVRSLYVDAGNQLWIGTASGGICRRVHDRFACYSTRHGLPSDGIFQILEDDRGRLWMSSPRGIFHVTRSDFDAVDRKTASSVSATAYGTSDGMPTVECSGGGQPAGWKSADGRLWFATTRGIVVVDPHQAQPNAVAPPVVVEQIFVDHRPVQHANGSLEVGPGVASLEVRYTGLSLIAPEKVQFKYMLRGFDRDWVPAGTRRAAFYTKLPPGRYEFVVSASNSDGVWNEQGASLALRVRPFFYQTPAFMVFVAVVLAGGVWAVHRDRVQRVRQRLGAIVAERNRMARELHDTVEQGMMAVSMQLQAAALKLGDSTTARQHLKSAQEMLNESLAETRRTVRGLRSPALEGAALPTAVARVIKQLTNGTAIATNVRVSGVPDQIQPRVEDELLRIAQESVTNAMKHAQAQRIDVELTHRDGRLRLSVRDDGCGFEPACALAPPEGHFGLVGMRERARRLGGELTVRTAPSEGTEIIVEVPLP
jgi:ligand-binding sensor domain-containing protein/signal transduction histidine kinase